MKNFCKRALAFLAAAFLVLSAVPAGNLTASAKDDIFYIGTAAELVEFEKWVNGTYTVPEGETAEQHPEANAVLTANIDLSTVCSETLGCWTPIGSYTSEFAYCGTFDGAGFTISNLYLDHLNGMSQEECDAYEDTNGDGLFGLLENATVKNLTVKGAVGTSYCGGLLAGAAYGHVNIENVTAEGSAKGNSSTALLIGYLWNNDSENDAVLSGCKVKGTVNANWYPGAMCGFVDGEGVRFEECSVDAKVTGKDYCGGLAGYFRMKTVYVSKASLAGTVECENYGGLLFGYAKAENLEITESDYHGTVTGIKFIGGLIGRLDAGYYTLSDIETDGKLEINCSCYYVGGVIGYDNTKKAVVENFELKADINGIVNEAGYRSVSDAGLFAGYRYGAIELKDSSFKGSINNMDYCSGLMSGEQRHGSDGEVFVHDCVFEGSIDGLNQVGGLVGKLYSRYNKFQRVEVKLATKDNGGAGWEKGLAAGVAECTRVSFEDCSLEGTVAGIYSIGALFGDMEIGYSGDYEPGTNGLVFLAGTKGNTVNVKRYFHEAYGEIYGYLSSDAVYMEGAENLSLEIVDGKSTYQGEGGYVAYGIEEINQSRDVLGHYCTEDDPEGFWIQTTYAGQGYNCTYELSQDASVKSHAELVLNEHYVKMSYTIKAGTLPVVDGKLGVYADIQIGDNDDAPITVLYNEKNEVIGFEMVNTDEDSDSYGAVYRAFFKEMPGVTPVSTWWIGDYWYDYYFANYVYQQLSEETEEGEGYETDGGRYTGISDIDSAFCLSWQGINLAPGESVTYSFLIGIGVDCKNPEWNAPFEFTANPDGVSGKVKTTIKNSNTYDNGTDVDLNLTIDGGTEQKVKSIHLSKDGELAPASENVNENVDLSSLTDDYHLLQFSLINEFGSVANRVYSELIRIEHGKMGPRTRIEGTVNAGDKEIESLTFVSVPSGIEVLTYVDNGEYGLSLPKGDEYLAKITFTDGSSMVKLIKAKNDTLELNFDATTQNEEGWCVIDTTKAKNMVVYAGGLEKISSEIAKDNAGQTVNVRLAVTALNESEVDNDVRTCLEALKVNPQQSLEYIDLSVYYSVNGGAEQLLEDTSDYGFVDVIIPFQVEGRTNVTVLHEHEGNASAFTTEPNEYGEYVTFNENEIRLHMRRFSTIAVAYNDAPKSGDSDLIYVWMLVLLGAVAGLFTLIATNGKHRKP